MPPFLLEKTLPKLDKFVLSMLIAVALSFIAPQIGAKGSWLHLELITKFGVSLVFFLHGANLSFEAIKGGASNWRLHILIQAITFILYPIFGFIFFYLLKNQLELPLRLGLFYLCALSSTISSSVTMTGIAKGNIAGAVFNATLSGLLGMLITPFLVSIVATNANIDDFNPLNAMFDIAKTLLMPFIIGHLSRPLFLKILRNHKSLVSLIDKSIIVLIVYHAFCNSNAQGIWGKIPLIQTLIIFILIAILMAAIIYICKFIARLIGMPKEDEAAALFCGLTKSLANGAPIASILFAGNPALGIILLPILIYHQSQLIICSLIANDYAK